MPDNQQLSACHLVGSIGMPCDGNVDQALGGIWLSMIVGSVGRDPYRQAASYRGLTPKKWVRSLLPQEQALLRLGSLCR